MNLQALLIRASVLIATCLILAIATLPSRNHSPAASAKPTVAHGAITNATPEPVLLPTIHVRPTADQLAERHSVQPSAPSPMIQAAVPQRVFAAPAAALSGMRLDMPYYSFGKVLPHVSKE
ncbi:MAG: hypothetical protein ACREPN_01690 [Rudaea sp.]